MGTSAAAAQAPDYIQNTSGRSGVSLPASGAMFVLTADLQGNLTACSPALFKVLDRSPRDVYGKKFTTLFFDDSRKLDTSDLIGAILQQGFCEFAISVPVKSGPALNATLRATLLCESDSTPVSISGMLTLESSASQSPFPPPVTPTSGRVIDGVQFVLASPLMNRFMGLVDRVASHTETVLITGETGTGKELIARTIHESSHRRSRPWVDINCAALPENLVESELFGYEKGAFSGADSSKPGLFELADKGTLFLDEIGELQLQTQVKLLRVLDGQPFYRLGGHRKIKVDVRVVAATNQDIEAAVDQGRFRRDLFHRLGQFQLRVPPLRERPEDIVALAEHFLRLKASAKAFAPAAISALLSHAWPGNIRELRNLVAKVAVESSGSSVEVSHIAASLSAQPVTLRQTASMPVGNLDSMEEQMIIKTLERTGGQRSLAAEELGISRRTLSRKLKEYKINVATLESSTLGMISTEQQKFFRAPVDLPVTLRNSKGDDVKVQGVNLSTGGMGLDGLSSPMRFSGLLDLSFTLPETETLFQAKARMMWVGHEGRVGVRFVVIEPALFEQLQHWTNKKMQEEGWNLPV
ncbi:MAG TPA: sigma 54-interacting transcriptional regulator [Candidatus Sulfotelmatobacter sp.]